MGVVNSACALFRAFIFAFAGLRAAQVGKKSTRENPRERESESGEKEKEMEEKEINRMRVRE